MRFPEGRAYRKISRRTLDELHIEDVSPIDDPILKAWQRILFVVEHYEAIYSMPFCLRREQVNLNDLVPTQSHVGRAQIDSIKKLFVPMVGIREGDKYYILDGHARSLRAKELGLDSIEAMTLISSRKISYGIVKTAAAMELRQLEDIRIIA